MSNAGDADAPRPLPVSEADSVDRRSFLGLCTLGLGACAGASVLGAVGTAVVGTPLASEGSAGKWVDLGPLGRFPDGAPLKVPAIGERIDAWNRFRPRSLGGVVVVRSRDTVAAFSSECPHLGCDVVVGKAELVCPCHDSQFRLDGTRIGGKSPRDLDRLEAVVEEGRVRVRFQRFVVGSPERKPV